MLHYFFTDEVADKPNRLTLDTIEYDGDNDKFRFGIYDELAKVSKVTYGGIFRSEDICTAIASIDASVPASTDAGTAVWGLNLNTMCFDLLGYFEAFDPEEHYESTEEIYLFYPAKADLEAFVIRANELGLTQ